MARIYVQINNEIDFHIQIYDDEISQIFFLQFAALKGLYPDHYKVEINDVNKWTVDYFIELVAKAKQTNVVSWDHYPIVSGADSFQANQPYFNDMHKDLEVIAGIQKYGNLDQAARDLVDELHCCLHSLEKENAPQSFVFQPREVVNFKYKLGHIHKTKMPGQPKFKRVLESGQVFLDFPYVGKEPTFCMMHNDNTMLQQTCKIIDRVTYTWKLYTGTEPCTRWGAGPWPDNFDTALTAWYNQNREDMQALGYSLQQVLDHTGFYPVGEIDNKEHLLYLRNHPRLDVTAYELLPI